jgi:TIR domain/Pentapeptide repeats (8 copies)
VPKANPEHLAKLKEGVEQWNLWRKANPDVRPDLVRADLTGANLTGANLRRAVLYRAFLAGANLSGADLTEADLRGAYMRSADLTGAYLYVADLTRAHLTRADLRKAHLVAANFNYASIDASKFQQAEVGSTVFGACDLSEAEGLDHVRHHGPSTIGIETVYLSKGKIPEIFLRGAGVPENFIEYMHSLVGQAFEFYSCFISYSTKDQEFADRLYADLQAKGVRCWFAPHDMESGKKLHEQIDQAIRLHDRLLLVLSPHSINSEWVKREIKKARNREIKEKKRVLFPIGLISFEALKEWEYLDPHTGEDIAQEICKYHIPDFTKWTEDHGLYQKEFQKLLKSLQPKGEVPDRPAASVH